MKNLPLFLLGSAALTANYQEQQHQKPNIIFILSDDIGYGDLSCYGAKAVQTPNIDNLASKGLRFTHAYSCSSTCTPSRYGLLTGQYPWRRSDTGIARGDAPMIIRPDQKTVASILKDAGYETGVVGKWHLGLGEGGFNKQEWNDSITPGPKQIGFDYSFIMAATGDRVPCVFVENQRVTHLNPKDPIQVSYTTPFEGEPTGKANPELLKLHPSHGHDQAIVNGISRIGYMKGGKSALWVDENIADTITTKAVKFIERNKNHPFFLYFCTQDIHVPRVPHPRFRGKTTMGSRGDAIVEFDWSVGKITETLKRLGIEQNTLIIVSSDNGPVVDDGYKDDAREKLGNHTPWGPLRGGKYSAFEAGTRVPFILSWPGNDRKGTSEAMISQIDLMATLCRLVGHPVPEGSAPDSYNQLEVWLGQSNKNRPCIIEQSTGTLALVEDIFKYIQPSTGPTTDNFTHTELGNDPEPQLYNLSEDQNEKINLAKQHPELVKKLSDQLKKSKTNP